MYAFKFLSSFLKFNFLSSSKAKLLSPIIYDILKRINKRDLFGKVLVSGKLRDELMECINGFGNVNSLYTNEDSYYSMFYKHNAKKIPEEDSRIRYDWYDFIQNKNLLLNEPFNPLNENDESCDSFNFSSFFKYNSNAFGWHWSGSLDTFTTLHYYKELNVFSEEELKRIDTYLRKRINR